MSELPTQEQLKINTHGIIDFFDHFTPIGGIRDVNLHDPITENNRDQYQLHIDDKGRLAMRYHSGETTIGHAAETSQRDFDYYRGKREGDDEVGWRYMTYPFEKIRWTDETFASHLAAAGITADTFRSSLTKVQNKPREESDAELIAGGATRLSDGHLLLTENQIEEKRKEMFDASYKVSVEQAQKTIGEMDNDTFIEFAAELQYAMKFYDLGYDEAQNSMIWNEGEHQSPTALDAISSFKRLRNQIIESPLYAAVRAGIKTRWEQEVPSNWTGWLSLQTKGDIDKIGGAIRTLAKDRMPIIGMIGAGVSPDNVEQAKNTIQGYGIKGFFVEDPSKGLLTVFHERWGPKPKG